MKVVTMLKKDTWLIQWSSKIPGEYNRGLLISILQLHKEIRIQGSLTFQNNSFNIITISI